MPSAGPPCSGSRVSWSQRRLCSASGPRGQRSDDEEEEEEEGEVEEEEVKKVSDEEDSDGEAEQKEKKAAGGDQVAFRRAGAAQLCGSPPVNQRVRQVDDLSATERQSLLRNELRPAIKPFKGNKLFLRFATQGPPFPRHAAVVGAP